MCGRPQSKFYHSIFAFASIFHNTRDKKQRAAKSRPLWWNCLFTQGMSHIPAGIDKLHTAALEIIRFDRE